MAKTTFNKLNLKVNKDVKTITINELPIEVKQYLPQEDKAKLMEYVIQMSLDDKTGVFSPIRVDTYFGLATVKWYTDIVFTDKQMEDAVKTYDLLQSNGIIDQIIASIPADEYEFISGCLAETTEDIAKFNTSLAGMITAMSGTAAGLDTQLQAIMEKIKNQEGLEVLGAIQGITD